MNEEIDNTEELVNDEELMDNKTPLDAPPTLEPNEASLELEPPKDKNFDGTASKKVINLLLKRRIIAIAALAMIFIIFFVMLININVGSKVNDYQYVKDQCDSVTYTYESYTGESTTTTLDIEKYVEAATYTFTKDFNNPGEIDYHTYKSLAIALRTEAVSNNCNVTHHIKLEAKQANEVLESALLAAKGLIATRTGTDTPLNFGVSYFCYSKNDGEKYSINEVSDFTIPTNWVQNNIKIDTYKNCPCNDPNQNLTSCWSNNKWLHYDSSYGYNVYAAKYLNEVKGFNAETLLKYFLGNHDIKTIIDPNKVDEDSENGNVCNSFDLHTTSLSRSEFISKLQSYTGHTGRGMDFFKEHAADIYDAATANNMNPEFVVVRAILEGFSPSAHDTSYAYKNNYWGYHCYNGRPLSECHNFSSDFKEAVKEYATRVNETYKDMEDVYNIYAQLDDYWNSGTCDDKKDIYPDGVPARVEQACANPGTVKTNEEDDKAYADLQKRNMARVRKAVFDIDEDDCDFNEFGAACFWWPIGSDATTTKNGATYATGDPAAKTITSNFGLRNAPTAGASSNHPAIDISGNVSTNTNIIAAADGEVTQIFTGCVVGNTSCGGGLGNAVYIKHNDGTETRYGHLSSVLVKKGDKVKQGQVIGKMGTTGVSTGLHLDFQVKVNGTPVNPLNYVSSADPRTKCSGDGSIVHGSNNKQTICKTLKHNGYSTNAIAAIMDNIDHESGYKNIDPNYLGCDGIVQWCYGRITTLKSTYGSNWTNLDNQLKFMLKELNSGYTDTNNYLKGNHSVSEMAYYFCMHYEVPGESYCAQRRDSANNYVAYVKNNCS